MSSLPVVSRWMRPTVPMALGIWALVASNCATLLAQLATGGSLSGYVTDSQEGAIADVIVTAVGTRQSFTHTATTDVNGYYRISNLSPDDYVVGAERHDFTRTVREGVLVREGVTLRIDFAMTLGATSERVYVRGETPLLEWTTAVQAMNITGELQRRLPLSSGRHWADFLQVAPAAVMRQARFQTYALHGTSAASGVFLVDGADATSALQGSTLYSQFASDTVADIHVKTGAIDASSALGLGPVVGIATRSGTDEPHGTGTFFYQPERWNDTNAIGGQSAIVSIMQADTSAGGPLKRGQWWFFGSFRWAHNANGISRVAQQVANLQMIQPRFTAFDNPWRGRFGFAKITGQLSPRHHVLATYSRDVVTLGGAQPNDAARFRNIVLGGPGYFARATSSWRSSLLTRVSLGYNGKQQTNVNLQPTLTGVNVYQDVLASGGRLLGSGLLGTLQSSAFPGIDFPVHMWTLAADMTWHRANRTGSHELQSGVYLHRRRNLWMTNYNADGHQLEERVVRTSSTGPTTVPFHRRVYDVGQATTTDVASRDQAVFAQDVWRATPRLTVSAGVRIDFIRRIDGIVGQVTQDSVEIGPRFGLNYVMTADHKNTARFGWNRIHENLSVNTTQAGTNTAGFTDFYDPDGNGTFPVAFETPSRTAVSSNLVVDLDRYHQGYADELVVGYQRQLPGVTTIGASLMRREYRDRPAVIETNGEFDGSVFVGYRDPTQNEIFQLTANTWNRPVVTSLELEASKNTRRVQLVATYVRQWPRLTGTWQPRDPASFIQPQAFPSTNGIGFVSGCTSGPCEDSDSLSGALGSGEWRSHVAKVGVSAHAPWQLLLATTYIFQSGPWSGPIFTRRATPDPTFGPATVTLSNGRVVSNPLATLVRFAHQTRSDGQFALGAVHIWNGRVARTLTVKERRVEIAVDLLNITNHNADQTFQPEGNHDNSPFFGQGSSRQFPRALQLSVRLMFGRV